MSESSLDTKAGHLSKYVHFNRSIGMRVFDSDGPIPARARRQSHMGLKSGRHSPSATVCQLRGPWLRQESALAQESFLVLFQCLSSVIFGPVGDDARSGQLIGLVGDGRHSNSRLLPKRGLGQGAT